jgi:hypothetical protein
MNMMFILALIVMALGTIIQSGVYNYRNLLVRLIISALLINFSYVIVITLIQVSDSLMVLMKPETPIRSTMVTFFEAFISNGQGMAGVFAWNVNSISALAGIVTKIIALVFMTVSVGAITLLLLVRLIGLWFLVILSPIYFGLGVLPSTRKYADTWRTNLVKYLIWGPVALFFLRVNFIFIYQLKAGNIIPSGEEWVPYVLIAGFLWAGFLATKSAGMFGASAITSTAEKYMRTGATGINRAYGNLFWRGTAAGGVGRVLEGVGLADKGAGKRWSEGVGGFTARLENMPKLAKEAIIDRPNSDRKKLIEKEEKRSKIKRNYFGDFDKDNASKIKPDDLLLMIKTGKLNEMKLRNLMEHGNQDTKFAIAAAYKEGLIQPKGDDFTKAQVIDVYNTNVRSFLWSQAGGKKGDMNEDFAKIENPESDVLKFDAPGDIRYKGMNSKYDSKNELKGEKKYENVIKNAKVRPDVKRFKPKDKGKGGGSGIILTDDSKGNLPPDERGPRIEPPKAA